MIDYACFTDIGQREVNEDSYGVSINGNDYCFIIADGLGGHGKGDVASQFVVNSIKDDFTKEFHFNDFLEKAIENAQEGLLQEQSNLGNRASMKSTVVALTLSGDSLRWIHIGDSRLYMFNEKKILVRTLDHSVPQMLVLSKQIKEKDIRNHPDRNRVLRAIGCEWEYSSYDISNEYKLEPGQSFLLCTDGFWELIDEKNMLYYLKKSSSAKEWLTMMACEVRDNGKDKSMDNNTAIVITVR